MEKYTEEKLKQLAQGVFADDAEATTYYADNDGTFLNTEQYKKLSGEEKKAFIKITNPAYAEAVVVEDEAAEAVEETDEAPKEKKSSKSKPK